MHLCWFSKIEQMEGSPVMSIPFQLRKPITLIHPGYTPILLKRFQGFATPFLPTRQQERCFSSRFLCNRTHFLGILILCKSVYINITRIYLHMYINKYIHHKKGLIYTSISYHLSIWWWWCLKIWEGKVHEKSPITVGNLDARERRRSMMRCNKSWRCVYL